MPRLRIQAYRPSNSAKALSEYLGIMRLKHNNSRFRARPTDIIINWGVVKNPLNAIYLNPINSVRTASDKLATFTKLKEAGVSIPQFGTSCTFANDSDTVVARTELHGHSGAGIVVGQPSELPHAPLYVQYIPKIAEYRAIVCNGDVVDFKQKLKRNRKSESNPDGFDGEHNPHVWNLDGGYVFARNNIRHPESADEQSIKALEALGLLYGAVDLIEDEEGNIFVLEINTAFGIDGSTLNRFGDKLQEYINNL